MLGHAHCTITCPNKIKTETYMTDNNNNKPTVQDHVWGSDACALIIKT